MEPTNKTKISIEASIKASIDKVWEFWTEPKHIMKWNNASDDWHTTRAENELRVGGKFLSRMEAKDGSFGFDFWGIYDVVTKNKLIEYTLGDGRKVSTSFSFDGLATNIISTFEAETENSVELQKGGWQSILNNFKKYVETN
jgi:uncharacterized protein YndB with AHSA1/START domain